MTLLPNGRCGGCNAPIFWGHTVGARGSTKAFPCNPVPDPLTGNVTVTGDVVVVLTLGQAAGARAQGVDLYTSHFKSCPQADKFRKAARSKR